MAQRNGEGRRHRHGGNAREELAEQLGGPLEVLPTAENFPPQVRIIRAEIIGENKCRAEGYTVQAPAPVFALCRKLIAVEFNPSMRLEAWRGNTLALTIRTLAEGAALSVDESRSSFCRWKPFSRAAVSPPMRRNGRVVP
jgi:hypothetical protein